jgi:hypothetical protein
MRQLGAVAVSRASPKLTHGAELPAKHPVRTIYVIATRLLLATMRISAHHAFSAEYDANQPVSVSGTVTRFEFTNPDAWLYVDGWGFEMGSPNGLLHRGWRRMELKKGDQVTVEGFRAKDGRKVANASTVTLPDGRKLFGGFQTTPGAPVGRHRP